MQGGCQGEGLRGCEGQKCPDRRRRSCVFLGRLETSESINANRQERITTAKSPARLSPCFKSHPPSNNLLRPASVEVLVRGGVTFEARKQGQVGERRVDARWNEGRAHILHGDLPPSSRRSHASKPPTKIAATPERAHSAQTFVAGRVTLPCLLAPARGTTPSSVPQRLRTLREPLERWRPSCTSH